MGHRLKVHPCLPLRQGSLVYKSHGPICGGGPALKHQSLHTWDGNPSESQHPSSIIYPRLFFQISRPGVGLSEGQSYTGPKPSPMPLSEPNPASCTETSLESQTSSVTWRDKEKVREDRKSNRDNSQGFWVEQNRLSPGAFSFWAICLLTNNN